MCRGSSDVLILVLRVFVRLSAAWDLHVYFLNLKHARDELRWLEFFFFQVECEFERSLSFWLVTTLCSCICSRFRFLVLGVETLLFLSYLSVHCYSRFFV